MLSRKTHRIPSDLEPSVISFFDDQSNTLTYLIRDPNSPSCAIIDSVLSYDIHSGAISYSGADAIIRYITENGLTLEWLLETHIHADHISASRYIQKILGGKIAIGEQVSDVQRTFNEVFNLNISNTDCKFDRFFTDGDRFKIGDLVVEVMHTPGHTPACVTYLIGSAAFVGDTVFMPDSGTSRADFPGGDAKALFRSIQRILNLPEDTKIYVGHDYGPNGREIAYQTTVKIQKSQNIHAKSTISESEFIAMREERDRSLALPKLILPSIQLNMNAGEIPDAESNGISYLKVPINAF